MQRHSIYLGRRVLQKWWWRVPSDAFENLDSRMKDIEQILDAHKALTQFQRARNRLRRSGAKLADLSKVVEGLVERPGRGRPARVGALNRGAMVLLCAHLQGYIEDVFSEAARIMLAATVNDVDALIRHATSGFSNPYANRINNLFSAIGFPEIVDSLSWQRASNQAVKRRLAGYISIRNSIAHGRQVSVTKQKVDGFKKFVELFAQKLDGVVRDAVKVATGSEPW